MEILVLNIIGGLVSLGFLWIATRDAKPTEKNSDGHHPA